MWEVKEAVEGRGKRDVSLQDANGFEWGPVLVALSDASDAALAGD